MTAAAYPLEKSTRKTAVLTADGATSVFGPFTILIFDTADVEVWRKLPGETKFTKMTSGVVITKTTGDAWAPFTVTFGPTPATGTQFYCKGKRVPSRSSALTKASSTALSTDALDKELTQLAIVQQEMLRDVDTLALVALDAEAIFDAAAAAQGAANGQYTFDTMAQAAAATIEPVIAGVYLRGKTSRTDGLGGLWVSDNTGSDDTFVSANGRTFYRSADVSTSKRIKRDTVADAPVLVQRKQMEPFFGFDNGTIDTQIYANAQFAPQGLSYYKPANGNAKIYINQSVGGTDWAADEQIRIVEFDYKTDGSVVNPNVFTNPLTLSHAHLTALEIAGSLYFYSSAKGQNTDPTQGGKGWSKIAWKGAATANADITNYYVFGLPGSGHRYQNYGKGCVCVSKSGKYVIINAVNYAGNAGGRTMFVYDRAQVEALGDPLTAEPVFRPVVVEPLAGIQEMSYQGAYCDDQFVYTIYGNIGPFDKRGIMIYELATGKTVRRIYLDGPAGQYTTAQLLSSTTLGAPASFEPEGITMIGPGELLCNFVDFFRTGGAIVTYGGKNWQAVLGTGSQVNLNKRPGDQFYWVETTRAATHGAWDPTVTYSGASFVSKRRSKTIYSVRVPLGEAGEQPLSNAVSNAAPIGDVISSRSNVPIIVASRNDTARILMGWDGGRDAYYEAVRYSFGQRLDIFDTAEGANQAYMATIRFNTSGEVAATFYGQDGTAENSAYLKLFGAASAANAGEARLSSQGTASVRLMVGGFTKFSVNDADLVAYAPVRPLNANEQTIGTVSRPFAGGYTQTAYTITSDENEKQDIDAIPDPVLDAWGNVNYAQFRYRDRVAEKGAAARLHTGLVAQRIKSAFEAHGLDAFAYGLIGWDEWGDEFEPVTATRLVPDLDENGELVIVDGEIRMVEQEYATGEMRKILDAGERYNVRLEEALAIEAAYQRRRADRAEARITDIEARLAALEGDSA